LRRLKRDRSEAKSGSFLGFRSACIILKAQKRGIRGRERRGPTFGTSARWPYTGTGCISDAPQLCGRTVVREFHFGGADSLSGSILKGPPPPSPPPPPANCETQLQIGGRNLQIADNSSSSKSC